VNILAVVSAASSKSLDDLSKDYQNLVEPVYQGHWLTDFVKTLGSFGFLSLIFGVGLIIFFGLLYFYRDSSNNLQNAGTITSIYFILLAVVFMLFGMIGIQANRSNYNTEVANYQSSVESIKSEYEAKFVEEKIMSKYDFESELDDLKFKYHENEALKIAEVTGIYDNLDSGVSYDLRFVVDENQDATLMINGDVTKELIESLKK